jgi:hypothetical protein
MTHNQWFEKTYAEFKEMMLATFKQDPDVKQVAREILLEEAQILDLSEKPVLEDELRPHLGNAASSTLARYRKLGMPYLKGNPNRYFISKCIAWYNENRQLYRKTYNH